MVVTRTPADGRAVELAAVDDSREPVTFSAMGVRPGDGSTVPWLSVAKVRLPTRRRPSVRLVYRDGRTTELPCRAGDDARGDAQAVRRLAPSDVLVGRGGWPYWAVGAVGFLSAYGVVLLLAIGG